MARQEWGRREMGFGVRDEEKPPVKLEDTFYCRARRRRLTLDKCSPKKKSSSVMVSFFAFYF